MSTYDERLSATAAKAADHAARRHGPATCPCHWGSNYDPHTIAGERASRFRMAVIEQERSRYAASRWRGSPWARA